jgi:hypothetical protein
MIIYNKKGGFELQDIFMFFIFGILLFVFVQIFSPITALFNFDALPNGAVLELVLNFFSVIILAGFIGSYVTKWNKKE